MNDFRVLAAAGRWEEVQWPWLSHEEQLEFLKLVRAAVPIVQDENGTECIQRHARPDEVGEDKALIEAATILDLGELEAAVDGEPPDDRQIWSGILSETEAMLNDLSISQEVTKGATALSRKQHAVDALDYLRRIEVEASWMRNELDEDDYDWLDQIIGAVAWKAFLAGRHAQISFDKPIEAHAVRGQMTIMAATLGAEVRKGNLSPKTLDILSEMKRHVQANQSIRNAARLSHKRGFGTSADANQKLWSRHRVTD